MWDLVANPEERFSHNEAQVGSDWPSCLENDGRTGNNGKVHGGNLPSLLKAQEMYVYLIQKAAELKQSTK